MIGRHLRRCTIVIFCGNRKVRYWILALVITAIVFIIATAGNAGVDYSTVVPLLHQPLPLSPPPGADQGTLNIIQWSLKQQQRMNSYSRRRARKQNNSSNDRIFFHETSGRTQLSFKETCAVESAALHNPQRPVEIFIQPQQKQMNDEPSSSWTWLQVLDHYPNVQAIVIDDEELYFKDSLLEEWYRKGQWRNSPYRLQHMADYIRMISLKKEGGMYLDLDVLTVKPYDRRKFWNFITVPSDRLAVFVNGILHLEQSHPLVDLTLQQQAEEYLPESYTFNGPEALSLAVMKLCNLTDDDSYNDAADERQQHDGVASQQQCIADGGIRFLHSRHFFPVSSAYCQTFFQPAVTRHQQLVVSDYIDKIEHQGSYGVHFYNSLTRNESVDLTPNSAQMFARLAARHCPVTLSFGHQFD